MTAAPRCALGAFATCALFLAVNTASAQSVTTCPAGQAIQSFDSSGKNVRCVPIPDVSGLQSQITSEGAARQAVDTQLQNGLNAEAAARGAGDTQLQNSINAEAASRAGMAAMLLQSIQDEATERRAEDAALRSAITEKDIIGTYAFSGPLMCITSSTGFNADLTPKASTSTTASAVVSLFMGMSSGTRTFNAGGRGTMKVTTFSLNSWPVFYTSTGGVGVGFNVSPPNPGGGASMADQAGEFSWEIVDGKLYVTEDTPFTGFITKGGSRVGWKVENFNLPRGVAVLGKDLRIISLSNDDLQVESSVQTSPDGVVAPTSFRICTRERSLRKL